MEIRTIAVVMQVSIITSHPYDDEHIVVALK